MSQTITLDPIPCTYVYVSQLQEAAIAIEAALDAVSDQRCDGVVAARQVALARQRIENIYELQRDDIEGATDSEKVDATAERLVFLEDALKSRNHTVQVMPDGIEVITVATGDMVRKFALTEVPVG